jgi:hypothetical protein
VPVGGAAADGGRGMRRRGGERSRGRARPMGPPVGADFLYDIADAGDGFDLNRTVRRDDGLGSRRTQIN